MKSALVIDSNHEFATNVARDTYFTAHPAEKTENIFITVGAGFQQLIGGMWVDKTAVIRGEQGVAGVSATYVHTQAVLSTSWIVTHNLGKRPAVTITDIAGNEVDAEIKHVDSNTLTVLFSLNQTGKVYCN